MLIQSYLFNAKRSIKNFESININTLFSTGVFLLRKVNKLPSHLLKTKFTFSHCEIKMFVQGSYKILSML